MSRPPWTPEPVPLRIRAEYPRHLAVPPGRSVRRTTQEVRPPVTASSPSTGATRGARPRSARCRAPPPLRSARTSRPPPRRRSRRSARRATASATARARGAQRGAGRASRGLPRRYCSGKRDGLPLRPLGINARGLAARLEGSRWGGSQVVDIAPSFISRFPLGSRSAMSTGCRWMRVTIRAER